MAYIAEAYHNVHAAPTSKGSVWACQIWFGLTRSETSATVSKLTVHWSAKLTSNAYLGTAGLMFRYKINSNGAWSGWYSLIGNGNYGGWRGSNLFTYDHGWYNNSEPYFTVSEANRSHNITRGDKADSTVTVYFDFRRSRDMSEYDDPYAEQTLSCTIPKRTYYWDINAYSPGPNGKQDYDSAKFDEYIGDTRVADNVTNESSSHNYQPYGTWVYVADIQPYDNKPYELEKVYNDNRELSKLSNGRWGHQITGSADNIYIKMRYKISALKTNLNYTNDTPDVNWGNVQYNSTTGSVISPPTRTGYKFLGWFTARSGGTQTHDANGNYIIKAGYWEANGVFKGTSNLTLYAHWEIQNVCYIKQDNTWKLSTVYIKTDNSWKPAIMYIKTDSGWVQSGP